MNELHQKGTLRVALAIEEISRTAEMNRRVRERSIRGIWGMQDSQELANGLDPEIRLEQGVGIAAIDFESLDGIADVSSKKLLKLDEEDSVAGNFSGELSTEPSSDCSTSTTQPRNNDIMRCRTSKRITWKCHCGHES